MESQLSVALTIRRAIYDEVPLTALMSDGEATQVACSLISDGWMLEAKEVVRQFSLYKECHEHELRRMLGHALKTGYLTHAVSCARELYDRTGDSKMRGVLEDLLDEIEFMQRPIDYLPRLNAEVQFNSAGPVIHVVGMSFPAKQTGFTIRTKYHTEALLDEGIEQVVVVQPGGSGKSLTKRNVYEHNGVSIVELPGPVRGSVPRMEWLDNACTQLLDLVSEYKPRVLHAHSDHINALIAIAVGRAANIPVLYEVRGFWEESFLARTAHEQGWRDPDRMATVFGYPDRYEGLRHVERMARERVDHLITLGNAMKSYILQEGCGTVAAESITVVPNAVDARAFGEAKHVDEIRHRLGIEEEAVVLGYVTTLSAYEGIETLIDAHKLLSLRLPDRNVYLLIVGEGPHGDVLRAYAQKSGAEGVFFAGRVPHEDVLSYYHVIDVFVVPRPKSRVTDLVTPLKPLEALAAGRQLVVSDTGALREMADAVEGAIHLFRAGDAHDLCAKIESALAEHRHPSTRAKHIEWLRTHRTAASNAKQYRSVYRQLSMRTTTDPHA
ncbi:glycosyltransferase [Nesterenkonia massiliensis]|uniref:D-inositol 3-phosphate glycosyltransferase n=1 Tax=Nesterenkonia massiliensis TaxID=1232429 RepID=A0ABT2HMK4_9MICC|nr:glycosyltransferase [Nesterenkonia massiliensis]MCT1605917.1 glycosyltransferase [Nesterenkonia massiliensis]